ncbi:nitrogen fixation protein FixH [Corticibacter populi]|uniref:Nitrogen fixation protein FixH n=1 Tax=Corticibacter populi TaxID=1550736 RepID=A0A3M6R0L5_9BURK|nr:FixH family protein [Corticibacter populi]RMX08788.1 nitrogen fixation protein FixH [Corticibacter populi]RZS36148.1 hypothetical protein EV687_1239 [Corticibacter populi]
MNSNSPSVSLARPREASSGPWWKFGYVWMVIAIPVLSMVASFYIIRTAINNPDYLVDASTYQSEVARHRNLQQPTKSLAPAHQARNHAATPVTDQPPPDLLKQPGE